MLEGTTWPTLKQIHTILKEKNVLSTLQSVVYTHVHTHIYTYATWMQCLQRSGERIRTTAIVAEAAM